MTGFWHRWMVVWCWTMVGVGTVFAVTAIAPLRTPTMLFLDLIFWPVDGQPAALSREAVLGIALCGAIMIGWGSLMLGLASDRKLSAEPRVWQLMTYAMIIWFVVDSAASWQTGAGVNVFSNAVFLISFLIPVIKSGALSGQALAPRAA